MPAKDTGLSSVQHALQILKTFTIEQPVQRIQEIANKTRLSKSSVSRAVATLVSEGFLTKATEKPGYELGWKLLDLAGIKLSDYPPLADTIPILKKLNQQTGEAIHLSVLQQQEVIYIHKESSQSTAKLPTRLGGHHPSHSTSSGKLLLAYSSSELIKSTLKQPLRATTPFTITNPLHLQIELTRIRQQGYATSWEEYRLNICSLAVPIIDNNCQAIASISLVSYKQRFTKEKQQRWVADLRHSAEQASKFLGVHSQANK